MMDNAHPKFPEPRKEAGTRVAPSFALIGIRGLGLHGTGYLDPKRR